jgi:hypothetical protein
MSTRVILEPMDAQCVTCRRRPDAAGLRRGMCRACYLRAWRGTALPDGASCAFCPERRRMVLRWTRVGDDRVVTCQNCGFIADRLRPRPDGLDQLSRMLERERRRVRDRRRNYVIDSADPGERRVTPRRARRRSSI